MLTCSIDGDLKCPTLTAHCANEHPTRLACLSYRWSQCRRSLLTCASNIEASHFWHEQFSRSRLWASGIPQGSSPPRCQSNRCWTVGIWWSARHNRPQPVLHLSSQLRSCLIHRDKFDKSLAMWVQWCLMPSRKPRCFWSKNADISSLKTSSGSSSQRRIIPHDHRDHGCLKKILVPIMSLTLLNLGGRRGKRKLG